MEETQVPPSAPDPQRDTIEALLRNSRTVAVVGASGTPGKPSHKVAFYLISKGFDVYPVNPTLQQIGEKKVYPDLKSIPAKLDVVDVFRKSDAVMPVVEEAIAAGAKAVWLQEGVVNEEAAARARAAGLKVVMDRCMMKEHRKLAGTGA